MTRALLGARRLAAALLLCACTHTPIDEATATAEAGYGRVFGRIELIEQEAWRANVSAWQKLTLFARSTGSPDMHFFTVQDDGSFNEYITLDQAGKQVVAIRATGMNGGVRELRRPVEVGAF